MLTVCRKRALGAVGFPVMRAQQVLLALLQEGREKALSGSRRIMFMPGVFVLFVSFCFQKSIGRVEILYAPSDHLRLSLEQNPRSFTWLCVLG